MEAPVEDKIQETLALPITPDQSGEHAAELTPNAALVDPFGGLTIDTDTEPTVPSPTRRASVSEASPPTEILPRSRHKSAIQWGHDANKIDELEGSQLTNWAWGLAAYKLQNWMPNFRCLTLVLPIIGAILRNLASGILQCAWVYGLRVRLRHVLDLNWTTYQKD